MFFVACSTIPLVSYSGYEFQTNSIPYGAFITVDVPTSTWNGTRSSVIKAIEQDLQNNVFRGSETKFNVKVVVEPLESKLDNGTSNILETVGGLGGVVFYLLNNDLIAIIFFAVALGGYAIPTPAITKVNITLEIRSLNGDIITMHKAVAESTGPESERSHLLSDAVRSAMNDIKQDIEKQKSHILEYAK